MEIRIVEWMWVTTGPSLQCVPLLATVAKAATSCQTSHTPQKPHLTIWAVQECGFCHLKLKLMKVVLMLRVILSTHGYAHAWSRVTSQNHRDQSTVSLKWHPTNGSVCVCIWIWIWIYLHSINPKQVGTFGYRTSQKVYMHADGRNRLSYRYSE
jgi:hypothetical protein